LKYIASACRLQGHMFLRIVVKHLLFYTITGIPYQLEACANPSGTRSKAWVCDRLLAGIAGSNPAGGTDIVVCCQAEVSALCLSLV
jgi:hypothetical protein